MDRKTDKLINKFVLSISKRNDKLLKAYLFGSYAKKTNRVDSDIDIALVISNLDDNDKFDMQVQLMLLASDFDLRLEPHPISQKEFDSETPLVSEIKKTGIEILFD